MVCTKTKRARCRKGKRFLDKTFSSSKENETLRRKLTLEGTQNKLVAKAISKELELVNREVRRLERQAWSLQKATGLTAFDDIIKRYYFHSKIKRDLQANKEAKEDLLERRRKELHACEEEFKHLKQTAICKERNMGGKFKEIELYENMISKAGRKLKAIKDMYMQNSKRIQAFKTCYANKLWDLGFLENADTRTEEGVSLEDVIEVLGKVLAAPDKARKEAIHARSIKEVADQLIN
eukprot:TRINITY_DN2738_c0_g1_i1.p1 TRINITY_DN2738_c0_g1~~TRINITY_DN2738_c0_g1_i1.p1  ORF type:complete len:237 (+),score=47.71 TRINITY_DN2738_c0_g1_i1:453-1163(+)